ncbi:MAG: hypothetical protein Q7U20_03250 [Caulobacter sp.]|nr:hypothetical protein [Caulobacter sp.]
MDIRLTRDDRAVESDGAREALDAMKAARAGLGVRSPLLLVKTEVKIAAAGAAKTCGASSECCLYLNSRPRVERRAT